MAHNSADFPAQLATRNETNIYTIIAAIWKSHSDTFCTTVTPTKFVAHSTAYTAAVFAACGTSHNLTISPAIDSTNSTTKRATQFTAVLPAS